MIQKSYDGKPTLYLIATPIGNMEDITYRAIETLKNVSVIFAEDTRITNQLLKHFNIKNKLISSHQYNEQENIEKIANENRHKENINEVIPEIKKIFTKFGNLGVNFFKTANNENLSVYISDPVNVLNGYKELAGMFVDVTDCIDNGCNNPVYSFDSALSKAASQMLGGNNNQADIIYYDNEQQNSNKRNVTYRQSGGSYASSYENNLREKIASENRIREEAFLKDFKKSN